MSVARGVPGHPPAPGCAPPSISIAMATCNGAAYIREQLDSFVGQTLPPTELIVSDDASTDGTLAIVEAFAVEAPFPVRIERNRERLGYSANFEQALRLASGEFVFFSDQDDVWFPQKIERMVCEFILRPSALVVVCDHILTRKDLSHEGMTKMANLRALGIDPLFPVNLTGCTTALRRSFARAVPPAQAPFTYDTWINLLADRMRLRRMLPDALQYWRRHGSNISAHLAAASVSPVSAQHPWVAQDARGSWRDAIAANEVLIGGLERIGRDEPELRARAARGAALVQKVNRRLEARLALLDSPKWQRPLIASMRGDGWWWRQRVNRLVRSCSRPFRLVPQ